MTTYSISGGTRGGWDRALESSNARAARELATELRAAYDPRDTSARVQINRDGVPVAKWIGSESGCWVRVVA